jgi:hypothetical protein
MSVGYRIRPGDGGCGRATALSASRSHWRRTGSASRIRVRHPRFQRTGLRDSGVPWPSRVPCWGRDYGSAPDLGGTESATRQRVVGTPRPVGNYAGSPLVGQNLPLVVACEERLEGPGRRGRWSGAEVGHPGGGPGRWVVARRGERTASGRNGAAFGHGATGGGGDVSARGRVSVSCVPYRAASECHGTSDQVLGLTVVHEPDVGATASW